jgi:ethanolaminephosphotransferase
MNNITRHCRETKKSVAAVLPGLIPIFAFSGLVVGWLWASPSLLVNHLTVFVIASAIGFGNIVGRMIVAHVVHDPFPYWNWSFLPMLAGALNANVYVLFVVWG